MPMSEVNTSLRCARSRRRSTASVSLRAAGTRSASRVRMLSGTAWSISCSTDARPSASSMRACSSASGPTWRPTKRSGASSSGRDCSGAIAPPVPRSASPRAGLRWPRASWPLPALSRNLRDSPGRASGPAFPVGEARAQPDLLSRGTSPERSVRLRVSGEVAPSAPPARATGGLSRSGSTAFPARLVAVPDERGLDDRCRRRTAANVDGDRGALVDVGPKEGERDAPLQHGREVPARHLADALLSHVHRVPAAWDLATVEQEPAQAAVDPPLAFRQERRASSEVALVEAHHPRQARLQRRDARTELVSVQRESRLQAEGVAGAEPGRLDPRRDQSAPTRRRDRRGDVQLDAVLPRVPGARDPAGVAIELGRMHREAGYVGPRAP